MAFPVFLSVIIPAYNEESRLENSLRIITKYLDHKYKDYEIIVVNDGSFDMTGVIAENFKKVNPNLKILSNTKNRGKGYSVKKGVLASSGNMILFTDADLSTPIEELERLKAALSEGYDIAIGSRALKGSKVLKRQSPLREYMGKIFNILVHIFLMRGIRDTQCGFKLFDRKSAFDLFSRQEIDGFAFDAEILYLAKKLGYGVKETPVTWYNSPDTRVKLFSGSLNMFLDLIGIKHLHNSL